MSEIELLKEKLLGHKSELRRTEGRIEFLKERIAELKNIIQKVKK